MICYELRYVTPGRFTYWKIALLGVPETEEGLQEAGVLHVTH